MLRVGSVVAVSLVTLTLATADAQEKKAASRDGAKAESKVAAPTGSALTAQEAQGLLNYHNKVRKEVGVGPLKWSPEVAKVAQEWADKLAETGMLEHRPNNKYGENLAVDSTLLDGAKAWYSENGKYTAGTAIDGDNFKTFGHYTQMVWRRTTEIGIGKAAIKQGPFKGQLIIVGNYNPAGNLLGEKPY